MNRSFISVNRNTHPFVVPTVLVTSRNNERDNVLTIAWFGVVCSEPPMVSVSIRPSRTSYRMIKNSGRFGLCVPPRELLKKVDFCGTYPCSRFDKFKESGLKVFYGEKLSVPLIEDCLINAECEVVHILRLGTHDIFIGEVVNLLVKPELVKNSNIDPSSIIDTILYCHPQQNYFSLGEVIGKRGEGKKENSV